MIDWKSNPFFDEKEFQCKCGCGRVDMDLIFIDRLTRARKLAQIPFYITSGFRCPEHNQKVTTSNNSPHLYGVAADIRAGNSRDRFIIIDSALKAGFKRIGIGALFVHLDIHQDEHKTQNVIWTYYD